MVSADLPRHPESASDWEDAAAATSLTGPLSPGARLAHSLHLPKGFATESLKSEALRRKGHELLKGHSSAVVRPPFSRAVNCSGTRPR